MKDKTIWKNIENNKIIIMLLIVSIIAVSIIGTYAWFTWSSPNNTELTLTIGDLADVTFNTGDDINVSNIGPVLNYLENGEITNFSIKNKSESELLTNINLNITNLPEELKEESFKYVLLSSTDNNVFTEVISGSFVDKSIGTLSLISEEPTPLGTTYYRFIIYIDGNMENPTDMMGKSFSGKLEVTVGENLTGADTITNIFTSAEKTTVVNNSVEYQYATSVGMMEDVGGNIRYYGADPNNYVSFNNELWRIIGVFKDIDDGTGKTETRIKIARSESIGNYQWDDYENEWSTATLQTYLNGTYLDSLSSEAQGMVGDAKWNLGGSSIFLGLYANNYYTFERDTTVYSGHSTEWIGKIALMYPSDYMYAGDLSKCSKDGLSWDTDQTNCRDTSWLRNTSISQWTLTPDSGLPNYVFHVRPSGSVDNNGLVHDDRGAALSIASRPVLFLNSTVQITGGEGTSGNSYTLG